LVKARIQKQILKSIGDIKVTLDNFLHPDFVFEKNYNLKSLQEIETYIKQNGHLPNIPSTCEVKKTME
jgi:hypothetical protein